MITGRAIMEAAAILLQDEDHIRWPLVELAGWINLGVDSILIHKPNASSTTIDVSLQVGTLQAVPTAGTPTPLRILGIVRNLRDAGPPRVGGRIIRPVKQSLLDAQEPNWHDSRYVRYQKEVRNFVFDEQNLLQWYSYPGNDGTGVVEALVSTRPAKLEASGAVDDIVSWEGDVGLPDTYSGPLLDYVCYRAQTKDDIAANAGRARAHFQDFATALGIKVQTETATSANRKRAPDAT